PQPRAAHAGAETVTGAGDCHQRLGHRRSPTGGRRKTGSYRTHRRRRQRPRRRGGAGHGGGAAQRFRRSAARGEDAGAGRSRRHARGRHAITHGLLAIGHGDSTAARLHADVARRHAAHDPLALLLHAQSAQLDGDREAAKAAFRAMAEREDTRLLGLRGLFIEAQRADDPVSAVMIAEEALKLAPSSTWASHAVLGFRCARGDWSGALAILDNNLASGLIDKNAYRRQRAVLLTARALELEK